MQPTASTASPSNACLKSLAVTVSRLPLGWLDRGENCQDIAPAADSRKRQQTRPVQAANLFVSRQSRAKSDTPAREFKRAHLR
jgi:hypothetical protein